MSRRTGHKHSGLTSFAILAWYAVAMIPFCEGSAYNDATQLFDDKLGSSSGYKTTVRPVLDQSKVIEVNVTFEIIAIVDINSVSQEFIVNGYLTLSWFDEIVSWDPAVYNNVYSIHPEPLQIWRPRLILSNTVGARDLFEDNYSPITALSTGLVWWSPGELFPASCKLDLYKYPFDVQECEIVMVTIGWDTSELRFNSVDGIIGTSFLSKNGEWTIESTALNTYSLGIPYFRMHFKLKRLPGFFIVNIIIPIVLMSFLNILVFLIPVDSGEKISYGITVLLALTVFMSIVSEQLPRSSDPIPVVTIYLLVLTIISVCTVIVSIAIVYCHHQEEKEVKHRKAVTGFKSIFQKFKIMSRAADTFSKVQVSPIAAEHHVSNSPTTEVDINTNSPNEEKSSRDVISNVMNRLKAKSVKPPGTNVRETLKDNYVNRWKQIGGHLDYISFIVFTLIWISVTIGFLVEISA